MSINRRVNKYVDDPIREHDAKVKINEPDLHVSSLKNVGQVTALLCSKPFTGSPFQSSESKSL